MFILRQYDTPLISFDISDDALEGQTAHIVAANNDRSYLFPLGMNLSDAGLTKWLRGRIVPKNREYVDALLSRSGLSHRDTRGILRVSRGLSLNDSYWVTEDNFDGKFSDYNLYQHDFLKVLSLIAYTGYGSSQQRGFSSSPEFTTAGMLRKGWQRLQGKTLLFKGGTSGAANTGFEPYSEFYASQVAERMQIHHVPYGLAKWKGNICSTCELFTDIDHSYVPMYRLVPNATLRSVASYLQSLGTDIYQGYVDMLVFDALICNEDRHFGNFGLMIDNKANVPYAFGPVFDHGLSLFNYGMPDDFDHLEDYAKARSSASGAPFENIIRELITPRQREKLRKMIGFRFKRHKNYNLPAYRLKAIENYLQKRAAILLSIPSSDPLSQR